jgi:putative hydrolase of the HAD superfamily
VQKFTTVIFDLFNTLISVGEVPESVGRFTADIFGFDHEQWNAACFSNAHEICQPTDHEQVLLKLATSIDPGISRDLVRQAAEHRQRRFDYALRQVGRDILEVIQQMKAGGIRLALVSNASTAEVAAWSESPLAELFDAAIFSCECGFKKPDVRIYRHALEVTGSGEKQSLFIGDGGSNEFVGAHQSGLRTVLTTHFSRPHRVAKVRQQQADVIHHEVGHIRDVLKLIG